MMSCCDGCDRWVVFTYRKWIGGHFGREEQRCFDCLSQHDQDEVRKQNREI